jgi:hypothetical protein
MKISSDTIGNRTRDLPVCGAVPQPLRHPVPNDMHNTNIKLEGDYIQKQQSSFTLKSFQSDKILRCNNVVNFRYKLPLFQHAFHIYELVTLRP